MTPARASGLRADQMDGKELPNTERRAAKKAAKKAEAARWTLTKLWESYKAQRPVTKSLRVDDSRFTKYLEPTLGKKEPRDIAPLDVQRMEKKAAKDHYPRTVKHILVFLKRIANYGIGKNLCMGLTFKVKPPKVDNLKTEFLTGAEVEHVLAVLTEWPDRQSADMMLLAVLTGLRRGELYSLQWRDVDFERGFIFIRTSKGGKSGHIPLNQAAADVLKNHPRISGEWVFSQRRPALYRRCAQLPGTARVEGRACLAGRLQAAASSPSSIRQYAGVFRPGRHVRFAEAFNPQKRGHDGEIRALEGCGATAGFGFGWGDYWGSGEQRR